MERNQAHKISNNGGERSASEQEKRAAFTWGKKGAIYSLPQKLAVMCRKTAQRYYRCSSGTTAEDIRAVPRVPQHPAATVPQRGTAALQASGTTGGRPVLPPDPFDSNLRVTAVEHGCYRQGTGGIYRTQKGLAVPRAVPPAVVPLPEDNGTAAVLPPGVVAVEH